MKAPSANLDAGQAIPIRMAFDPGNAKKSFCKLHKSLKPMSKHPSPKRVHNLRTRIRRVEAVVHALMLDRRKEGKHLLKALAPTRKRAGKVRDMDVLIGFAVTISNDSENECLVQLVEHLELVRMKAVRNLRNTFSGHRKQVRRRLKEGSLLLEKRLIVPEKYNAANREWSADATAAALNLWTELSEWQQLNTSNLHSFRLKVKELRYILELAEQNDSKFLEALENTNDAIGEWHDWNELAIIASDAIEHGNRCPLIKQLRHMAKTKLDDALSRTNAMRRRYQDSGIDRKLISLLD